MSPLQAFRDGLSRVRRAPGLLACVYLLTLLTVLPFTWTLGQTIAHDLGYSLAAEQAADGVHQPWWGEFQRRAGELGRTFRLTIIGFAAVLDNTSALADGAGRPAPIVWLGGVYLGLWLFLTGGIVDRLARNRPTTTGEFFTACGVYFLRFLRLAPAALAVYACLFLVVRPYLLDDVYGELVRDVTAERAAFAIRMSLYAIFVLLVVPVNILFDYAKVRAIVEDRRSMVGALLAAGRFIRRSPAAVACVYALHLLLFLSVLAVYALTAPGATAPVWLILIIGQAYILARLWVRLVGFASQTALFQGRLAHAGYVAAPPIRRPEPPIVEQIIGSPASRGGALRS